MNKKKGNTKSNTFLTAQAVEFKNDQLDFSDFFFCFEHGKLSLYYSNLPLFFLACTTGNIQRQQGPEPGGCATTEPLYELLCQLLGGA